MTSPALRLSVKLEVAVKTTHLDGINLPVFGELVPHQLLSIVPEIVPINASNVVPSLLIIIESEISALNVPNKQ